jgi:hypothetical protein
MWRLLGRLRNAWLAAPVGLVIAAACVGGGDEEERPTATPGDGAGSAVTVTPTPQVANIPEVTGWNTDWSKSSIDLSELSRGIFASDPRDIIKPIDNPEFETVDEASGWLVDREPVVLVERGGEARAYPLQILTSHEVVNDEIGMEPLAVTFCPLCNSAVAFERTVDGQILRFGVSGLLRNSDLVMWDRQTESLWQQITGEAIVGELAGTQLRFVPSSIVRWSEFRERFPGGTVLAGEEGSSRRYGSNPYDFYDSSSRPFLFGGELDDRFPAMERVVGVIASDEVKGYPFSVLSETGAANDEVGGTPIAVFWGAEDTASALDHPDITQGRSVGTGVAYERTVDGRLLTFESQGGDAWVDLETRTVWNIVGEATDGPLAGAKLVPAVHANHFWFAFAAFFPEAAVYGES